MPLWDGTTERRKVSDHDTVVELCQIMKSHIDNFESHRNEFSKHKDEDDLNFKSARDQIGKHAMWIYIGMGIIGTLQFILKH